MGRHSYATTISFGGDTPTAEVEVEVSYEVDFGTPESGRFGPPEHYDPGSGDEVHSIRLETVEGKPRPWGMYDGFVPNEDDAFERDVIERLEGSDDHLRAMVEEARESEVAAADDYAEMLADERRLEARRG